MGQGQTPEMKIISGKTLLFPMFLKEGEVTALFHISM